MQIEVSERTYNQIKKEADIFCNGDTVEYIKKLMDEVTEIVPTKEEKKEWKKYLYDTCWALATERPEIAPRKKDSLKDLEEKFFYWASEYNDGYFSERDEADTDNYCAWLVQEYEKYYA